MGAETGEEGAETEINGSGAELRTWFVKIRAALSRTLAVFLI